MMIDWGQGDFESENLAEDLNEKKTGWGILQKSRSGSRSCHFKAQVQD